MLPLIYPVYKKKDPDRGRKLFKAIVFKPSENIKRKTPIGDGNRSNPLRYKKGEDIYKKKDPDRGRKRSHPTILSTSGNLYIKRKTPIGDGNHHIYD